MLGETETVQCVGNKEREKVSETTIECERERESK